MKNEIETLFRNEEAEDALIESNPGDVRSPQAATSVSPEALPTLAPAMSRASSEHAEPPPAAVRVQSDPSAQYSRYRCFFRNKQCNLVLTGSLKVGSSTKDCVASRCLGGGRRVLRRQWSLERGDAMAAARAGPPPPLTRSFTDAAPAAANRPPRYRTRPAPLAPAEAPS